MHRQTRISGKTGKGHHWSYNELSPWAQTLYDLYMPAIMENMTETPTLRILMGRKVG